jgi:RNA polymerase sigma factor (sigma-70 family)
MTTEQYNRCVDEHADGLYRFLLGQLRGQEDARDLVQDAFEVLWKRREEVAYSVARSFLFRVAYRDMIDKLRKNKRLQLVEQLPEDGRSAQIGYTGAREALDSALAALPEIQKTVVLLRDYEGYDYREIGEITGLGEAQVKVYIYRARKALQQRLGAVQNLI